MIYGKEPINRSYEYFMRNQELQIDLRAPEFLFFEGDNRPSHIHGGSAGMYVAWGF